MTFPISCLILVKLANNNDNNNFFPLSSGILSSLAVLYSKLGQEDKSTKCLSKLLSLSDNVCGGDPSLPDEVLYGRAGYLFSLLFVQKHLGEEKIPHDIINQVWYMDLHLCNQLMYM